MATANTADFLGEGTSSGVQKPYDPNDEPNPNNPGGRSNNEMRRMQIAYNANPKNRQGDPAAAARAVAANPAATGLLARRAIANQKAASKALAARNGGFFGDLGRLGAYTLSGGPAAQVTRQSMPQGKAGDVLSDTLLNPTNVVDEAADQIIPGGSGAYGGNLSPTAQLFGVQTGRDDMFPSETVQSDLAGGYKGVTGSGNTGVVSGLIDGNAGYPAARLLQNAASRIGNAIGGAVGGGSGASGAPIGGTPQYTNQNGGALSAEAQRILGQAGQMAQQSQAQANTFYGQAAQAGTRAAPQMAMPSSAQQDAVYDRAMNFNAQSGSAAIRAAQADVSGAGRLESMQMDQQGINNLESFQSTNTAQGVNALYGFRPDETFRSAAELANFYAQNTAEGANAVRGFSPDQVQADAQALRTFKGDRTGIDRLNAYADAPEGPSAAQATLRGQADADKRTQLAIARSFRGGPGAAVQAQRQAMTEGGLIQAETRGQAATLRAQETDAYKSRQLQALAQAGSLISQAEAQRLTALSNAGALMSQADQQKLTALQAYSQAKTAQDSQQLSAKQSAGQLTSNAEGMLLNATSNAAQLQGQMDAQRLGAISNAAQLRTQGDQIRSSNLQSAGNIRLQGSEINQRGAIAASNADLQAQALNLQSLSLAGNISTAIRSQNIDVLKSNLSADLQTMGLNDQQVRFFSQMASDREVASQNLQMQANSMGANLEQAQQALDLQWAQFGFNQLTTQQQAQYQQQVFNATNERANRQEIAGYAGAGLTALSRLFGAPAGAAAGGAASGGGGYAAPLPQVPSFQLSMPQIGYQNVGSGGGANAAGAPAGIGQLPNGGQLTMPTYQTPYAQQYGQPSEVSY